MKRGGEKAAQQWGALDSALSDCCDDVRSAHEGDGLLVDIPGCLWAEQVCLGSHGRLYVR